MEGVTHLKRDSGKVFIQNRGQGSEAEGGDSEIVVLCDWSQGERWVGR